MRWVIEIGKVDIEHEVSVLSSCQADPCDGHLQQILHIFAFLKNNPKLTLYCDTSPTVIDLTSFTGSTSEEIRDQYRGAREELSTDAPKARGRAVEVTSFFDASHASDKKTRRSHTGYIILVNRDPITCYSKRQADVESRKFWSEFIALKACVEHIIALRFKLRMFGIPIGGESKILNYNKSVVDISSKL